MIQSLKSQASNFSINLLLFFYIFFTLLSFYLAYYYGNLGGDVITLDMPYKDSYIIYLLYGYLIPVLIYLLIFHEVMKIKFHFHAKHYISSIKIEQTVHILFFVLVVIFFFIVTNSSLGTISKDANKAPRVVELFFALLQLPYLIIIYIYFFNNSKSIIYLFNRAFFLFSAMYTGFTGYLLFFAPFIFFYILKRISKSSLILSIIFFLPLLPFLHVYKFILKYHLDIMETVNKVDFKFLEPFARSIIDRFSYIPNIIFIDENKFTIGNLLNDSYNPFYQGYFGSLIHKAVYGGNVGNINGELFFLMVGKYGSNSTFPIVGYFYIDSMYGFFVLLFTLFLFFIFLFFIKIISFNNDYMKYLFFVLTFTILMQGWFWPFINFLQATIIFTFFILIINFIDRKKK